MIYFVFVIFFFANICVCEYSNSIVCYISLFSRPRRDQLWKCLLFQCTLASCFTTGHFRRFAKFTHAY